MESIKETGPGGFGCLGGKKNIAEHHPCRVEKGKEEEGSNGARQEARKVTSGQMLFSH